MPANCEFCGSPSLHGAKLCAACRSALKRARHDPVSVLDALQKSKSAMRRRSRQKEVLAPPPPAGLPPQRRRGPAPAVVGGILAVLCLLTYGLLQHLDGARAGLPAEVVASPPAAVAPQANALVTAPVTSPLPAGTDAAPEVPANTEPLQSMPTSVEPLPVETPHPVVPRPKRKAPPAPPPPVVVEIAPVIPAPAPAPPPPPKPAPPPSREAQLATAFAACTSPDAMEKAICQQRARVDLCEGFWGLVPQCPARRESGS